MRCLGGNGKSWRYRFQAFVRISVATYILPKLEQSGIRCRGRDSRNEPARAPSRELLVPSRAAGRRVVG